jgi:lipopolysaccharide export system protein LptA
MPFYVSNCFKASLLRSAVCAAVCAIMLPILAGFLSTANAQSEAPATKPKASSKASPLGLGSTNSKEPIKIDADRLDVFDKDKRAVFNGNVIAVQGETTIRCTTMTVFYEQSAVKGGAPSAPTPSGADGGGAIKKIDCVGPVTVVQKDQVATGNNANFDKIANIVTITGNAALSQGQNVTRGEKLVYNLTTGVANVEGGRVRALFVPGSANSDGAAKPNQPKKTP